MKYVWEENDIKPGVRLTQKVGTRYPVLKMWTIVELLEADKVGRKFALLDEIHHTVSVPYKASELVHNFNELPAVPNEKA
jgi:hypothetical protein